MIYRGPGFLASVWYYLSFLVFLCCRSSLLRVGERGAKSYDREKAWSSINHSILFAVACPGSQVWVVDLPNVITVDMFSTLRGLSFWLLPSVFYIYLHPRIFYIFPQEISETLFAESLRFAENLMYILQNLLTILLSSVTTKYFKCTQISKVTEELFTSSLNIRAKACF
jgi:hypothetical protein